MTFHEQHYSDFYRNYLSVDHGALITNANASWPGNDDVPRICSHDGVEAGLPSLVIVAAEKDSKHWQMMKLSVFVRLHVRSWQAPLVAEAVAGTPTETALAWLTAVQQILADSVTLRTYLLSLPTADRSAGQIMQRRFNQSVNRSVDNDNRTATWEIEIEHDIDVSPE